MPLRSNKGSVVKQGCWKSEDQGHQFQYHMTRKLRDAFPLGLHRDAFQLDSMHAVGSELESRYVYAEQLLPWRRNSGDASRFPAEFQSRVNAGLGSLRLLLERADSTPIFLPPSPTCWSTIFPPSLSSMFMFFSPLSSTSASLHGVLNRTPNPETLSPQTSTASVILWIDPLATML